MSGRGRTRAIWRTVDGVEQKRCPVCGQWLPADKANFYYKRERLLACRPCSRGAAREYQRDRYVPGSRSKVQGPPKQKFDASALMSAMKVKP